MNYHPLRRCSLLLCTGATLLSPAVLKAQADQKNDEVTTLDEFRVETNKDNSYLATETTSGTRIAQSIIDLPYSVQVIPKEFFNDFMLFDIDDMDGFVSNVTPADPAGAGNGGTKLRGFGVPYFRNGFAITQQPDSNNVDRVEILKGPAGAIYGATAPGGVMNFITKKPESTPSYSIEEFAGSYDYKRTNASATGPITDKLFYRADVTYYDQKRPTDFWFNRTFDFSSGLLYKISNNTSLDFEVEYTKRIANPYTVFTRFIDKAGITEGYVNQIPDALYPGLASRLESFNQAGAYNRYERYNNSFYLTFQHRFDRYLSMQANLEYTDRHYRRFGTTGLGNWSLITNTWTSARLPYHATINYQDEAAQLDFTSKFEGSGMVNQSHLGMDGTYHGQESKTWEMTSTTVLQKYLPAGELSAWQKPDPYNLPLLVSLGTPAFNATNGDWPLVAASNSNLYTEEFGIFLNHSLSLWDDRVVVMGTIRHDEESIKDQQPLQTNVKLHTAQSRTGYNTYSTGIDFKVIGQALVAYANYGTSFDPSPTVDANTSQVYGNVTAKGGEGGLKGILLKGIFSYTADVYSVREDNQTVTNPDNPGGANPLLPANVPGGSSQARGVGVDISGRVTDDISLIGNIGWNSTRTIQNVANPATVGQRLTNSTPARQASIAGVYRFSKGWLKGWRTGVTYTYASEILETYGTATTSTAYRSGYRMWGGMASYSWRLNRQVEADFHFAVSNIFNEMVVTANGFAPVGGQIKTSVGFKF